jgi:LPS sulfotransferase NodH
MTNDCVLALPRGKDGTPCGYAICTTPRTRSWLLCDALDSTGVAGHPIEAFQRLLDKETRAVVFEGLVDEDARAVLAALPLPPNPEKGDIVARVRAEGTTANGAFGTKLMWRDLQDLAVYLQRPADASLMRLLAPQLKCIYLSRVDKDAQAVSYCKALQTGEWQHGMPSLPEEICVYSYGLIDHARREVVEHDLAWQEWFAVNGIEPLHITDEQLDTDREETIARVLRFIGVDDEPARELPQPKLRRQANALTAQWLAFYRRDRDARERLEPKTDV